MLSQIEQLAFICVRHYAKESGSRKEIKSLSVRTLIESDDFSCTRYQANKAVEKALELYTPLVKA